MGPSSYYRMFDDSLFVCVRCPLKNDEKTFKASMDILDRFYQSMGNKENKYVLYYIASDNIIQS